MARVRLDVRDAVREGAAAGAFGAPSESAALVPFGVPRAAAVGQRDVAPPANVGEPREQPASATGAAGSNGDTVEGAAAEQSGTASRSAAGSAARSWLGFAGRVVRNALIATAVMALVPIGLVAVLGGDMSRMLYFGNSNTDARVHAAESMRPYRVSADASITPMQAGLAFNALQQGHVRPTGYALIDPGPRPAATWRTATLTPDMFPAAQPDFYVGPSSRHILEVAASGVSARELAYLRVLAMAPIWRDFDLVARAPAVDIIGGQFKIPFSPRARPEQRPITQFGDSKELAYAAVSRAAYHVAVGQRDSAEAVLRSLVSFGFSFIDNGSTTMDALIGTVIVGIGRDALQRLYVIEHDARASAAALAPFDRKTNAGGNAARSGVLPMDEVRHRLLARIDDPALPLGVRFGELQRLSNLSCTNTRELVFGPRDDVRDLLARLPRTLARFPSERALIELETRPIEFASALPTSRPLGSLAISMATVAGAVFDNPRFAQCTAMLAGRW